jgi:hypothetical protein
MNILGRSVHTIQKNREALAIANEETSLEVNQWWHRRSLVYS